MRYRGGVAAAGVSADGREPPRTTRSTPERRPTGAGAFPDPARAKVLFTGVEPEDPEELRRLATGARAAAARSGAEVDGGRFRPHVTIARIPRQVEATRWLRVLGGYRGPTWLAEEVTLVASHLGEGPRGRPRYEPVESFTLGTGPRTRARGR